MASHIGLWTAVWGLDLAVTILVYLEPEVTIFGRKGGAELVIVRS